ncbi:YMGG-like glycine zipper-containing protein [Halorubrum sp. CBA1229]|jgi:ribosomal protein S27AE|uniref:YMGG-like glycine zipper-containing protein n=1 Tax=Halorubrum sp. CBA1229 TaxID=1853699 RepID=UPI000F41EF3B|nr:YMGG-like glycine zipper-containing protein [Halorubrum sp. CBA1229]QKY17892.1 hypothetical protein Hrr1229_013735 [Halorubrum sp. CBA1229]
MKVYVECSQCGEKIYLDDVRDKRTDYPASFRLKCGHCDQEKFYNRNQLEAEPDGNSAAIGTLLGGATGALAGPVGAAIGAGVGGVLGSVSDNEDQQRVEEFYGKDIFFE